jgi:Uncharacterised nucleotidyltransferase
MSGDSCQPGHIAGEPAFSRALLDPAEVSAAAQTPTLGAGESLKALQLRRFNGARTLRANGVGEVLLACIRADGDDVDLEDVRRGLRRANQAEIPHAARYHRVVAPVHDALRRVEGVDSGALRLLHGLHQEGTLARFAAVQRLHQVRDAFGDVDFHWLVLKGPVLSEVVYRRHGLRLFHDLDVLVRPEDFGAALSQLEAAGFGMLDPNWSFHLKWVAAELRLGRDGGADIDLHWQLPFSRQIRRFFRIPIEEMIERSRELVVHSVPVRTLDEVDTVLHLALHAALEGGDRLVWLKDVQQAISVASLDWDLLVERARLWRVNMPVGTILARVTSTLGATVPPRVVRELLPQQAFRIAVEVADRLFPPQRSTARGTIATHLARNARVDLPSTLAAMRAETLRMVRQARAHERWRREKWHQGRMLENDPRDPSSKLRPVGGERDRAAFLTELSRESSRLNPPIR